MSTMPDSNPPPYGFIGCRQKGFDEKETAFAVKICERLVLEYHELIDEFAAENVVLESILQYI
ncbi:MAG: hypothetical protein DRP64_10860, partial [Verrucomicrobia bacterium]